MGAAAKLNRDQAMLLVIDVQTKLLPHVEDHEQTVAAIATLLQAAPILGVPVMATVQYVKGLGPTEDRLADLLQQQGIEQIEKAAFSVCCDGPIRLRLAEMNRSQAIVAGIEAHVCVEQTVLDLLASGVQPFVCVDAVSSRYGLDLDVSLNRMQAAGAVITTVEAVLFELCNISGTPEFKELLKLVKSFDEARQ